MSISFLFLSVGAVRASEFSPTVMIVNQVRGAECCDRGSLDTFQFQVHMMQQQHLLGTFALRYDALEDPAYMRIATQAKQQGNEIAAFLEITPKLAQAAGVRYEGATERWYKAQYAYVLGYDIPDRKKLLDTVMASYKRQWGAYPTATVAWMIDADSLAYLHDTYGIAVHEMTREQFSTDSYTLYGGVPNTPYFPSKKWPLLPANSIAQSLPVMIVPNN